jgi:hypothetical protein
VIFKVGNASYRFELVKDTLGLFENAFFGIFLYCGVLFFLQFCVEKYKNGSSEG